jgi:hypothetical protein
MRSSPFFAAAAVAFAAFAAPGASAEVTPQLLQEITQDAAAAFKAANPPKPKPTPEQVEADKKAIKSHCNAVFARMAERDSKLPSSCD